MSFYARNVTMHRLFVRLAEVSRNIREHSAVVSTKAVYVPIKLRSFARAIFLIFSCAVADIGEFGDANGKNGRAGMPLPRPLVLTLPNCWIAA